MEAKVKTVSAPVGGWNTRDSLDRMKEDQAPVLDNWWPSTGSVDIRKGYEEYCTGLTGDVETLAEYWADANHVFIAAANGNVWDITNPASVSSLASGFSSNRWQWANMDGKIGFVNGTDTPQQYDGSTFGNMTLTHTDLTATNVIGMNVFKHRSYFWMSNSQDFYYSATNALGGALLKFPLSRVAQFGGNLISMETWTRDGGDGVDDLAAFFMSSGEVVIYQGTDPGSSSDWAIVGVFHIGAPVSDRAITKVGGDLVAATRDGYVSLNGVINKGRFNQKEGVISDQINRTAVDAVRNYGGNFGWEAIFYPAENALLFNVPITTNTTYEQHAFNTLTGAPTRFKGWNARTFGMYNDQLYFGGAGGKVYTAFSGYNDDGANIQCNAIMAPNYLGDRSRQKLVTATRVVMASEGDITINTGIGVDFQPPATVATQSATATTGATWDVSLWDADFWSGGTTVTKQWQSATALGFNILTQIKVAAKNQIINWYSIEYMFKKGGVI